MLRETHTDRNVARVIEQSSHALGRRERNKLDKMARIKRAARTLFAKKGFEATTTREIAESADVGAGTLFLYFKTKEEILVLLFREEMGHTLDAAFATVQVKQSLLEQLLHIFNAVIAYHEQNVELARIFVKELQFVEGRLRQEANALLSDWYERMAKLIEGAQERGELREDVPPLPLARNCFALYFFQLKQWLSGDLSREKLAARLRLTLELQLCGLLRGATAKQLTKALSTKQHGTQRRAEFLATSTAVSNALNNFSRETREK
jgi:AcrR family transcriptional regulator